MKKIIVAIVAALGLFVTGLLAADFNGKWAGEVEGRNGKRPVAFTLKAEGEKLTGSMDGQNGPVEIMEGKITGDEISFSVEREMQGEKRKIPYTGKLVNGELQMKTGTGERQREFTMKKATS